MSIEANATVLRDNPSQSRFELWHDDQMIGLADYISSPDELTIAIPHTEIDPQQGGNGYGSIMVRDVLDTLRARGQRVIPQCSFVAHFIEVNPAYRDLVA